jgi:protein gp37
MGKETGIEWCDRTWNPWIGCTEVHEGCKGCYAKVQNAFRKWNETGTWGSGAPRHITSELNWKKPHFWAREAARDGRRISVFPSLCDPLDEEAPQQAQAMFWNVIRETAAWPSFTTSDDKRHQLFGLNWILLTKRPGRWRIIPEDVRPLVALLTSVSNQRTADLFIPELLRAEGFRLCGLSIEPLLGPVDLREFIGGPDEDGACRRCGEEWETYAATHECPPGFGPRPDWIIVGGESGGQRRPSEVTWYQSIADQCRAADVPVFMKQDTAFHPGKQGRLTAALWALKQFPEALRRAD